MSANIVIDMAEFDRTIRQYVELQRKEIKDIVVRKAYQIAGGFGGQGALQQTYRANVEKIRKELDAAAIKTIRVSKKTGAVKWGEKAASEGGIKDTLGGRVVIARALKANRSPPWGGDLATAVKKLIAARVRSVNFIRSGWIGTIQKLAPLVGSGGTAKAGARQVGAPKGTARVMSAGDVSAVEIINRALNPDDGKNHAKLAQIAEEGLGKAFASVTADMQQYIERKLQAVANKMSAK